MLSSAKEHNMLSEATRGRVDKNEGIQWKSEGENNNKMGCTLANDQAVPGDCLLIIFPRNTARALRCSGRTDSRSGFMHIIDTVA